MNVNVSISDRDLEIFKLLEMTPATARQIRKVSVTFPKSPFRDDRRVRERMQALATSRFVSVYSSAIQGGGLSHYYRLTTAGFRMLHREPDTVIPRTIISEIAPSRFQHAMATADVIVHTLVACHRRRIEVLKFHGDSRLVLEVGESRQIPDCHFQLQHGGCLFNVLFEVDNATEPLDSRREQSIRSKILGYETYQDWVLKTWRDSGRQGKRPSFRVVFLTKSAERANHILWLAHSLATNKDRRLVYASTQDVYLASANPLTIPIMNDHHGYWQALVNIQPTSDFQAREPVRLKPPVAQGPFV